MLKTICLSVLLALTLSSLCGQDKPVAPYMTEKQLQMEKKLREIIIPELNFEDADILSITRYLSEISAKFSKNSQKVNIIVILTEEEKKNKALITVSLSQVPLYDALNYLAMLSGMTMKVDEYAVILKKAPPKQVPQKQ